MAAQVGCSSYLGVIVDRPVQSILHSSLVPKIIVVSSSSSSSAWSVVALMQPAPHRGSWG